MKGVWVKKRYPPRFNPKRHFFTDDGWVKESVTPSKVVNFNGRIYPWYDYVHKMTGSSLCRKTMQYGGVDYQIPGKTRLVTRGGLSIRKKVKLNQRNLCWNCLVKYMKEQPQDIQRAFQLLNKLR